MPNTPNFRNPYTGEVLAHYVEVCTVCHRNFSSTRAGDAHRVSRDGARICLDPSDIGLELTVNSHGSLIYRTPSRTARAGITAEFSAPECYEVKELINTR